MIVYGCKVWEPNFNTACCNPYTTNTKELRQIGETIQYRLQGDNLMKYNRRKIMSMAWKFFRNGAASFALALRMAWQNIKTELTTKAAAGITEETHTWAGWKAKGYEVIHESKALFKAVMADPKTKTGTRLVAYFGLSQVQEVIA